MANIGWGNNGSFYVPGSLIVNGESTEDKRFAIGNGRTGDGNTYIDLIGDNTNTLYGTRIIRAAGENGATSVLHKGTGAIILDAVDGGDIRLVANAGDTTAAGTNVTLTATAGDATATASGDVFLNPTGNVKFGTLTGSADAPVSGYITIKTAAGATVKLAVIT